MQFYAYFLKLSLFRGNNTNLRIASKLYIPSTLNIDPILWQTQLIVCAENVKSWFKSWLFPFIFLAYILPHTMNCFDELYMCYPI